ncbi:MAG TPA: sarcosine oxidase subunit gamma [Rhodospirillales bacterium]|nr:sarcosine oxidase subunit gamma [Rhodospirillales bacterium]
MVDGFHRQSALASLGLYARPRPDQKAGVRMGERPFHTMIGLRGDPDDAAFLNATKKAMGLPLPLTANTTTGKGRITALWMGPDEWLIAAVADGGGKIIFSLEKSLADLLAAVFDVSDSRTIIELSGKHARHVLMKGCAIDFHPRAFGPGQCVQSTLALAHVLIHQTAQNKRTRAPTYNIYVHRSFAEYLWTWLEDAAGEYGVEITVA